MKIELEVCSFQYAVILRELGLVQKSRFFTNNAKAVVNGKGPEDWGNYSAYTVAELGVMLPEVISYNKTQKASVKFIRLNGWSVLYTCHNSSRVVLLQEDQSEADARAKALIRLILDGFEPVEQINSRLEAVSL